MQIEFLNKYIHVFSRDQNNNRCIERHLSPAYFYVDNTEDIPNDPRIIKVEEDSKVTLYNKKVKKITVRNPFEIKDMRNLFYNTYEADIPPIWRHWINNIQTVPQEKLRKLYLDIETTEMPGVHLNDKPITCIGFWDNYTNLYYTIIINRDECGNRTENREGHIIYHCPNEYDLLTKFINLVHEFNPDMLIAHNGEKFDYPVIIGRLQTLSVMGYGKLSPLGIVSRDNSFGEWKTKIAGRILFDFLGAKTSFGTKGGIRGLLDGRDITIKGKDGEDRIVRIKRWSLAYLAQFVGMQKGKYNKVESREEMITYNRLDVEIMVALDKFFNVTEYYHNMQILIGCPFEATYFNTNMIDIFLLKRFPQYAFPTKPVRGKFDSDSTIQGATVDDPVPGIYPLLYVVDQTSLYPTVVISSRMSPENVDPNGDIKLGNGVCFNSNKKGIIADAVEFLLEIRLKYKKLSKSEPDSYKAQMYGLLSDGYKTLLVSFYGALLYKGFRLYDYKVAESIPFMGRVIKEHVRKIIEQYGYKTISGDTDSSFLIPVTDNAVEIKELVKIINLSFDDFAKSLGMPSHRFNIELDKIFSPIIISDVKKRYVGYIIKNGKKIYKVTGFEAVRRDTAPITEQMQETVFKMILAGAKRKEIEIYITQLCKDIKDGKYPMDMLMLPKGFSKKFDTFKTKSPWITGIEYSNKHLGMSFDHFSETGIFYIKQVPEGKVNTEVVAIDTEHSDIVNGFVINWDLQLDKLILSKVQNIYDMLKWIPSQQKTLGEF